MMMPGATYAALCPYCSRMLRGIGPKAQCRWCKAPLKIHNGRIVRDESKRAS
jgi:hypothetical protein